MLLRNRHMLMTIIMSLIVGLSAFPASEATAEPHQTRQPSPADHRDVEEVKRRFSAACRHYQDCAREVFFDVVFGNRFDQPASAAEPLIKLKMLSRFVYSSGLSSTQMADLAIFRELVAIAKSSGVSFGDGEDRSDIVPFIVLSDERFDDRTVDADDPHRDLYDRALVKSRQNPDWVCWGVVGSDDETGYVTGSMLLVRSDTPQWYRRPCLARQFLRTLGLRSTTGIGGLNSILAHDWNPDDTTNVTVMDHLLISLLYDAQIRPLMSKEEIKAVFMDAYNRNEPELDEEPDKGFLIEDIDDNTASCLATIECVKARFLEMAVLGSSIEPRSAKHQAVNKVIIPLRVALIMDEELSDGQRQAARLAFDQALSIARFLGVPIIEIDPDNPILSAFVTTTVFVTSDGRRGQTKDFEPWKENAQWRDFLAEAALDHRHCFGQSYRNRHALGNAGFAAMIDLPSSWGDGLFKRCVLEETIQGLGLSSDIDAGVETLFDDRPDNMNLTYFDIVMMTILYHPRIEPGMNADQVSEVFDQVYAEVVAALEEVIDTSQLMNGEFPSVSGGGKGK